MLAVTPNSRVFVTAECIKLHNHRSLIITDGLAVAVEHWLLNRHFGAEIPILSENQRNSAIDTKLMARFILHPHFIYKTDTI
jgi:hypothetical protein